MKVLKRFIEWFCIWWDKSKGYQYELMCYKRLYGKFYIVYKSDNKKSQLMDYYTALDYASIYGGSVYHVKYGLVI